MGISDKVVYQDGRVVWGNYGRPWGNYGQHHTLAMTVFDYTKHIQFKISQSPVCLAESKIILAKFIPCMVLTVITPRPTIINPHNPSLFHLLGNVMVSC